MPSARAAGGGRTWTVASICLAALELPQVTSSSILGVPPAEQAKYAADTFRCFDGIGSAMPSTVVNDEFCDCADGSDEPGTGACAGQEKTLFHCVNEGSVARRLYASRVGDGVCDCCDGSDEVSLATRVPSAACSNVCAEQGQREREELKKRSEIIRQGVAKQEQARTKAVTERATLRWELARLKKELVPLEAKLQEVQKRTAALREAEEAEKKAAEAAAKGEEGNAVDDVGASDGPVADAAPVSDDAGAAAAGVVGQSDTDATDAAQVQEGAGEKKQVSEYAKWMDGAESMAGGSADEKAETTTLAPPLGSEDEEDEHAAHAEEGDRRDDEEEEEEESEDEEYTPSGVAASSSASPEEQAAAKDVKKIKDRTTDIEKTLDAISEEHLGYADLAGVTLSLQTEWNYKATFFDKAEQDHTSLGSWKGFIAHNVAEFDGGQSCWEGPQRKLTITFECGAEAALLDVYEPSKCVYAATATHPAACDPTELETEDASRVIGPKDEL